jgi:AraC-like DNA-binding protein
MHVAVEVDEPAGHLRELARGSVSTLTAFRHHRVEEHRDPLEERFERPVVIFTTFGSWGIRSDAGSAEGSLDTIVIGAAGRGYRASHEVVRPTDTTFCVEFADPIERWDPDDAWGRAFARVSAPRSPAISRIHRALACEASERRTGFRLKIDGLSFELVAELARARGEHDDRAPVPWARPLRSDVRDRVHAARSYLDANLVDDVDLRTLARAVALSPFYLSRLFRHEFGIPPHAYLSRARLELGASLLTTTPLSVTQVSERVGWRSVSHFTARFRRHFGVTPSAYRRLGGR